MIRILFSFAVMALILWTPAKAEAVSDADSSEFQRIISAQIAAFNADDGPAAYSHAAPMIQQMFPTPEMFMSMVKNGYAPVYRQQSFSFGEVTTEMNGRPTQRVAIVDTTGKLWTALYSFEKQPDGTWKISGCMLVQVPAADA